MSWSDEENLRCQACGLEYADGETEDNRCPRCGTPKGEGDLNVLAGEAGYRRGFQQGFLAALEHLGVEGPECLLARAVSDWRYDRASIGRSVRKEARGVQRTEQPPRTAGCRHRGGAGGR